MNVLIRSGKLTGTVPAPASKSEAHRLLICAALADRPTRLTLNASSEDIEATVACLRALGAKIEASEGALCVTPLDRGNIPPAPLLDCGESGSTLRFMLPVAAALCPCARLTGRGRLPERPIGELLATLSEHGVTFSSDRLPLDMHGRLRPGAHSLPGDVSSQYVTGLLLALPLLEGPGSVTVAPRLKSAAYVDITLTALSRFGVRPKRTQGDGWERFEVAAAAAKTLRSPEAIAVGGDWSNAAFFLTAGALCGGGGLTVTGLDLESPQGDRAILKLLEGFGARVSVQGDAVTVTPGTPHGGERRIDIDPTPDLLPILAVMAAGTEGTTTFTNAARLRLKESDRIATTAAMLRALGGRAEEGPDLLSVTGGPLSGGVVDGAGDHRIVMAAAVAATRCDGVTITGAEAARKSYPAFFDDYRSLGGDVHVL